MGRKLPVILAILSLLVVMFFFSSGRHNSYDAEISSEANESLSVRTPEEPETIDATQDRTEAGSAEVIEEDIDTPVLTENPTREELESYARQRRLARAEQEGRLQEYLSRESQLEEAREARRALREKRRQRALERHKLMRNYREQKSEALRRGETIPERPTELRNPTHEE